MLRDILSVDKTAYTVLKTTLHIGQNSEIRTLRSILKKCYRESIKPFYMYQKIKI